MKTDFMAEMGWHRELFRQEFVSVGNNSGFVSQLLL